MDRITEEYIAKTAITTLIAVDLGIDLSSAADTVEYCQEQIDLYIKDYGYNISGLKNILFDCLGIGEQYLWIFAPTYTVLEVET